MRKEKRNPRKAAFSLLLSVLEGEKWLNRRIVPVLAEFRDPRDRGLITLLSYGTVKNVVYLDWVIRQFLQGWTLEELDPEVRVALRMGAFQLLKTRIPPHAAVYETVALIRRRNPGGAALVNAVLRRLAAKGAPEPPEPWIRYSLPRWLYRKLVRDWGEEWARRFAEHFQAPPPIYLRVNTLRATPEQVREFLRRMEVAFQAPGFPPETLQVEQHPWELKMPEAVYYLQDRSTQMLPYLLGPQPGEQILDLTAAPGGKASHMAALMENRGFIVAVDLHLSRARLMKEVFVRLGVEIAHPVVADGRTVAFQARFPHILLDAPCTGLGTLRRKPEIALRMRPERIPELVRLQRELLSHAAELLEPGGELVYATCTITPEENERQVEWFLKAFPNFRLVPAQERVPQEWTRGPYFWADGVTHNCDYAFGAILWKER